MNWVQEQKPEQAEIIVLTFMRKLSIQHLTDIFNRQLNPQYSIEYLETNNEESYWKITQNGN